MGKAMLFSIAFIFKGIEPVFSVATIHVITAQALGITGFKIAPIHIPLNFFSGR